MYFSFTREPSFIFMILLGSEFGALLIFRSILCLNSYFPSFQLASPTLQTDSPTNLTHIAFGIVGAERLMHYRKHYINSWWRPNATRGFLFLDTSPNASLLPWSPSLPPYKVSPPGIKTSIRLFRAIAEVFREMNSKDLRWLVMGDDDSIFFVDNIVTVLQQYDHTKPYYIGGLTEWFLADYWYTFHMGYGGAGIILSYPVAKAIAAVIENCTRVYGYMGIYDHMTMACTSDMGITLTVNKGMHQMDLHGDVSGFFSSHPNVPLLSFHRMHAASPYFPGKNHTESLYHLMTAAVVDQSRILQMTVCHNRPLNWSISVSWGYSAYIYESIFPRSHLQKPIETFNHWTRPPNQGPNYIFDTRPLSNNPCEAPHVFFLDRVESGHDQTLTTYLRSKPRDLKPCASSGNHTADFIMEIHVISPSISRKEIDRCECCDVVGVDGGKVEIKYRECRMGEIIA